MANPKTASREEWLEARLALLEQEKALTRQRDAVSAARRKLPRVKIDKDYRFQSEAGEETLADLFEGRSQLIVQHFMFGEDWNEGCKSCSLMAENYDGVIPHLGQRDVSLVAISHAPLDKLIAFRERMGWGFKWVSSLGSDFNVDFDVSYSEEEVQNEVYYNYRMTRFPMTEAPGMSVFALDADGSVYHTYSCYGRGLDPLMGTYQYLDLVPKGRDEDNLSYGMEWVRHHDKYQ
ncbi:MAG: thioredoxin [Rhodospirillaceae bacterium]|nr:thioredoxin [Rhodospirillaceae bacterium]|tara:strand:- start:595 stop:1296 length:702 start_codon:yes stop_codon:yes gene_type:complete